MAPAGGHRHGGLAATEAWPWLGPVFLDPRRDNGDEHRGIESKVGLLRRDGTPKQARVDLTANAGWPAADPRLWVG